MKEKILQQIYDNYINSDDFNGLNISSISEKGKSLSNIIESLIELVNVGKVNVVSSEDSLNIYINRFGFMPIENQVRDLQNFKDLCCYPSISYLKDNRDVSKYEMLPFDKMLALGTPQLELQYFQWDVLDKYSEDPRFEFIFRDYEGEIYSLDVLPESEYINLKTFGAGKNENNIKVVAAYPRYLKRMSPINQIHWYSKMINREHCKVINDYFNNTVRSCWHFPDSVYTAILKEMSNINEISTQIWDCNFFKKEFLIDKPKDFGLIFKPTLSRYNSFLLIFEKVIPNNINPLFFDKVHNNGKDKDGKTKGTLNRFREWLKIVNPDIENEITKPFRDIRDLRQAPAHKIESNIYDYGYFNKQQEITQNLLEGLILYRKLLLSHPKAINIELKYNNKTIVLC